MQIAIFGAGAVGGYFGGRLAQAGHTVVFVARGEHLQALQRRGLQVQSIEGDFVIDPVQATDDPATVGVVDAIIVAVKTWQLPEAAEAMRPMVGAETFVVPLENGVEAPAHLAAVLGEEHVLGGLCRIISTLADPGHVHHSGISPTITFGELDGRRTERVERLRDAFKDAEGLTPEIAPDIHVAIWRKFLFIAALSGVGAVTRVPVGVLRDVPETRQMLIEAMEEIVCLARARDVALPGEAVDETLCFIDDLPAGGTASMQRDILAGQPSELESQNGAVVRLARGTGVSVPLNAFIYGSLLPQELRARGRLDLELP